MDISRSKVILKKINALHESAEAFDSKMSRMEKDLLLHYLRELYELILEPEDKSGDKLQKISTNTLPDIVKNEDPIDREVESPLIPKAEISKAMVDNNGHLLNIEEEVQEEVLAELSPLKEEISPELENLFEDNNSKDLSSKYSSLPISDIAKSMGINDRILTINELFGGDQASFNECTRKLNAMEDFSSAKIYLLNGVAREKSWGDPSRKGKAVEFIQLIKRRYL